jgi:hypothetical protein
MFVNKLIIWFVLYRKSALNELRYICGVDGTIERFCTKYMDQLRKILGKDRSNALINNLDVLLHVMILSKIIRDIQSRDPEYMRLNKWPLRVFNDAYAKSIKNLCESSDYQNEIMKKSFKLGSVLKEYSEFEGITLNEEDILRNTLKIISEQSI